MQSKVTLKPSQKIARPITWAQLNLEAAEELRGLMRRNRWAAELILALIQRMLPGAGGVVVCSRVAMSEMLGCSIPTTDRALKVLIEEGWVQRLKIGGASALAINCRIAWVGDRGDLAQAVFSATVIATRKEQDLISLNPAPLKTVPAIYPNEEPILVGKGKNPPSEPELDGIPPVVAIYAEENSKNNGNRNRTAILNLLNQLDIDTSDAPDNLEDLMEYVAKKENENWNLINKN